MNALSKHFGVSCECFASPLNAHFERYCSAFADTDVPFGSLGSFFETRFLSGSYEANPPFEEQLMNRMADHMLSLLKDAQTHNRPLSFVVVGPQWTDSSPFIRMQSDEFKAFLRGLPLVVGAKQHFYADGLGHLPSSNKLFKPVHNSWAFFLQTDAAHKLWPPTPDKLSSLKKAWAQP